MSEQIALVPEAPPTLTPITTFIYDLRVGPHPPIDPTFVQSIRRYGVLQPPVVRLREGVGYDVVDGRRRAVTLKMLHDDGTLSFNTQVPVMLLEGDCSPSVLALMLNEQRSRNPASDLHAIEDLAAKGASLEEIAAATGMGKGTVAKRMRLANLILNFRALFDEGKLPVGIAERLATLPAALQGDLYLHYAKAGKITHGDISEMRHAQQQEAVASLGDILTDAHEGGPSPEPVAAPATASSTSIARNGEEFYPWAQKLLASILVEAPSDAPRSCLDSLGFVATIFADLAESQAPDFLAEDERVDISDVVPIDDTPYDEEYETESEAAD